MNKKIKLSILATLLVGSSLSVSLPIVACSSSNNVNPPEPPTPPNPIREVSLVHDYKLINQTSRKTTASCPKEIWVAGIDVNASNDDKFALFDLLFKTDGIFTTNDIQYLSFSITSISSGIYSIKVSSNDESIIKFIGETDIAEVKVSEKVIYLEPKENVTISQADWDTGTGSGATFLQKFDLFNLLYDSGENFISKAPVIADDMINTFFYKSNEFICIVSQSSTIKSFANNKIMNVTITP